MENTENKIPNSENQDTPNSSFFSESISSSNGLEPSLRFGHFVGNWKKSKLSSLFKKCLEKNENGLVDNVICNSAKNGLMPQRDFFDKDIANTENTNGYYIIQENDFVYNPRKSNEAPYGPISMYKYKDKGIVSPLYLCFRATKEIHPRYFEMYFKSSVWHKYIYFAGDSGARYDRVSIKDDVFFEMPINIPSLPEQQKIADFLSLIDQRIEKQRKLVENLKKYKRGLFFEIFEQKRRFKDGNNKFYPKWEKKSLGTIFKERTERAIGNEELLSVTINSGVKKRCEVDVKDNSSDDKSKYKKLYPNDIAYNTMRMWQGASGVSLYEGIVSPAYTVITPIIPVKIGFFGYYFKYIKTIQIFQKFSQGLTSDTWNLKYPQLSEIQLLIPNIEEQEKIYETFKFLDDKILLSENTLNLLQDIKKGLLQKMFI